MTDDLAARLLAAIEETERIAQAAADSAREHDAFGTGNGILTGSPAIALHVRRQDPKSTLIRCAADRRTVERHPVVAVEGRDQDGMEREGHFCDTCDEPWPCGTIQDRAFAYGWSTEVVDDA